MRVEIQLTIGVVFVLCSALAHAREQPMANWGVHTIATQGSTTYEGDKLRAGLVYGETGAPRISVESIHVDMGYPSPNRVEWTARIDLIGDRPDVCPIAEMYCATVEGLRWHDDVLAYELVSPSGTLHCRVDGIRARRPETSCDAGGRIVHVVLVWLNEPGNAAHRARIVDATREFAAIPGVGEINVGEPIPGTRATVDDSFDVGLTITFASRQALSNYLAHPAHRAAQRTLLRPLVRKAVVYDFEDAGG